MSPTTTLVSSPGKVLVAGGYLVLDPLYSGTVVSTSSRFYTLVTDDLVQSGSGRRSPTSPIQIRVRSPQFVNATWTYKVTLPTGDNKSVLVEQVIDPSSATVSKNKFVQLAIDRTIALASEILDHSSTEPLLSNDIDIIILGDNDFYSQRAQLTSRNLPPTLTSLTQLPSFLHTNVPISQVHKTGLGSSAALITSLVSALLLHLKVIPPSSFDSKVEKSENDGGVSEGRRLAHNLAQYVHCLAQGKIGSGFDVSAACFGSQIYTRFGKEVLDPLMSVEGYNTTDVSLKTTLSSSNPLWNYRVEPFQLPPSIRLMLADVDAGSDTPSLVGKVLKWRKERPEEAKELWDHINLLNQKLSKTLRELNILAEKFEVEYKKVVKYLSSLMYVQWLANPSLPEAEQKIIEQFYQARQTTEDIRAGMRKMGSLSSVPIEPPEQTDLLDTCISVAGVIGGGVPGAGGYDAIWLLVFDPEDCPQTDLPSTRVEGVWSTYKSLDVSPLLATESKDKGVRIESVDGVKGLKELLSELPN
ncbi:ribosomal protein S5 domain 2-type protein [Abortiporus biennis]|nr:ribosomal protein S5 domain 2-type protein [Abortiporus biennis]